MIICDRLCKTYKMGVQKVTALNEVSLMVEQGEFLAITGKSGSGKSTLLHTLGGIDSLSSGCIKYDTVDITKLSEDALTVFRRNNIGFVFQQYYLLPELSASENIIFPSCLTKTSIDMAYYNDLVETLNLTERLKHLPSQLSGGQMQRVAIARALINKPKVLLCDEPTGNLDSETSHKVISAILRIREKYGQTIIMVTHDDDLANLADRKITIKDGKCIS